VSERLAWPARARSGALLALLALVSACGGEVPGASVLALTGATLFDGTGRAPIVDAVVLVSGDSIACAGSRAECTVPDGASIRDLGGAYVTPGLVDAHVHVGQSGWLDGRPDGLDLRARYPYDSLIATLRDEPDRWYRSWTCAGITAAYDVGGMMWTVAQARRDARRHDAPHMVAAGPLVTHGARDILSIDVDSTFIRLDSEQAGVNAVRRLKAAGSSAVKVWLLAPPDAEWPEIRARFDAVAAEAKAQGLPLIVHATALREARAAVRAGAHMLVHSVQSDPIDSAFVRDLVAAGTVYVPTLVVSRNWSNARFASASGTAPVISDPLGCVDPRTRALIADAPTLQELESDPAARLARRPAVEARLAREEDLMAANLRALAAAGATIAVGTDAGNPLTLHGASIHDELAAMERAGIAPESLLVMATRNGARAMRRDDFGTLRAAMSADLLVLGADPGASASAFAALRGVMLKGAWVREPEL
jgi:imidazolonepropionase-like amidohydrolase